MQEERYDGTLSELVPIEEGQMEQQVAEALAKPGVRAVRIVLLSTAQKRDKKAKRKIERQARAKGRKGK